jgi:hypothetical protein
MSSDSLTPIGPLQFVGINGPGAVTNAAAVIGPDQLADLIGGVRLGGANYSILVTDPATYDPEARIIPSPLPIVSIELGPPSPALVFSVTPQMVGQPGAGVMVVLDTIQGTAFYEAAPIGGAASGLQPLGVAGETSGAVAFPAPTGFHLEWVTTDPTQGPTRWQEDFTAGGGPVSGTLTATGGAGLIPYAGVMLHGQAFTIEDNQARLDGAGPIGIPGEPAHGMTEAAAAALAGGTQAAVGWVDSGTDYVALFDATTGSFGPVIGLDWGGASDLHLLALPDGGFVASWQNDGAYRGEVFAADGAGGGVIPLAGDVAGVTAAGALYTLDSHFNGQQYQIDPGQVVSTSEAAYTAPAGVRTVDLAGQSQTVTANGEGDVLWSNNSGNALIGGAAADTFYIGRGGDWVRGGGGADVFKFDSIPWAGAHILDFTAGDTLDLTLMLATVYPLGDPIGAGYLELTDDGGGDAQVWADYHLPANGGFWLVATLSGVNVSNLHYDHGLITV